MHGSVRSLKGWLFLLLLTWVGARPASAAEAPYLDLARFAREICWCDGQTTQSVARDGWGTVPAGGQRVEFTWDEERDVSTVRIRFEGGKQPEGVSVQYWQRVWPPKAPKMPTIEDPLDDIWQGNWLTAAAESSMQGGECIYTFKPLSKEENPLADNLVKYCPDVRYRRTLRLRLAFSRPTPKIESIRIHSPSTLKPLELRIELGAGEREPQRWSGRLEIDNGLLVSAQAWNFQDGEIFRAPAAWENVLADGTKGVTAKILASAPAPAGSNDITIVTVRGQAEAGGRPLPRTFSFSTLDLEREPIYIPDLHAYVTLAETSKHFAAGDYRDGKKIRDLIPAEPEQTYERASREIPPLDAWNRQEGKPPVYLPLAADASWQKFAVEYGGNVTISKEESKAKGRELKRLLWDGDTIRFMIGTGSRPDYREDQQAKVSMEEQYLPIVNQRWKSEGVDYEQAALATLLEGPLDPMDPGRDEQTPAVLMIRLRATNPGPEPRRAEVWFSTNPAERLEIKGRRVYSDYGRKTGQTQDPLLRAVILGSWQMPPSTALAKDAGGEAGRTRMSCELDPGKSRDLSIYIPFVSDVGEEAAKRLEALDFEREHGRVREYWEAVVNRTTRFSVPEPKFSIFAKAVIPHIHISTTKCPKSGYFMVPAASYKYQVYANEACFQILTLDALGDTATATRYLEPLYALQGSRPLPGNFIGPSDDVFHGVKVDETYDYTAHKYNLDHGTVLWTLALHYLYSRDRDWFEGVLPRMFKAIEWIERQRAATMSTARDGEKALEYGLLPAGHLEDNSDWGYWFSVNAFCVAGMRETARALREIRHPEAERIARQAEAYAEDLRTAVRRTVERAPVVRMRDGTYSPYVPTRACQRLRNFGPLRLEYYGRYNQYAVRPCFRLSATREVLYGPMILAYLEIFDPGDPIYDWILDDWEDNQTLSSSGGFNVHGFTDDARWFSQGGMVFQANLQNPVLVYLQRNETPAAIRGLYNNFVSCLYPDVNAFTEEYRQWRHASGPFYKSPDEARFVNRLRDALVLESGKDLWLASGAPRRWVASQEGIRVESINTWFGPVGYRLAAGPEENTITAHVEPPTRDAFQDLWLYVRVPEGTSIAQVRVNGKPWTDFDAARERIRLPHDAGSLEITVGYR